MPYLILRLHSPRISVTSPVHGCSTQPGFNALHALLPGVIFDNSFLHKRILLATYFLQLGYNPHPWLCSSLFSVSSRNTLYLLDHCLPSCYSCQGFLHWLPSPQECLLYLGNAVFRAISHFKIYLSQMDSPTPSKYREINGQIFMLFWSKQQIFPTSWRKSSPRL